ncbi:unnamed protein product [Parnassius apollo]|uniref:(apollo) hypothetical protein n=1 Tax=Parnassius apollo TaxID=110799 RepID=A0A8S3WWZ8_PARAO|nr:unnamed protein product [Parnassius apollo]
MTAENSLFISRLSKFDISLETDITAIATDGPNIMLDVGRLVCTEQQLCLAHRVNSSHLCVLYKNIIFFWMDDSDDDDHLEDIDCSESGLVLMSQNDLAREMREHIPGIIQDKYELIKKIRSCSLFQKITIEK